MNSYTDKLLKRLKRAKGCDPKKLQQLEEHLRPLEDAESDEAMELVEADGIEEEVFELLNDSEWCSDSIGPAATSCPELLRLVHRYLCPLLEDFEIVLATSPHTPEDVLEALISSDFVWEAGGTTQALARNSTDPRILKALASSTDNSTRHAVASNPHTPSEVLDDLVRDADISDSLWQFVPGSVECLICYAALQNPSLSKSTALSLVPLQPMWTRDAFEATAGYQLFDEEDEFNFQAALNSVIHNRISSGMPAG